MAPRRCRNLGAAPLGAACVGWLYILWSGHPKTRIAAGTNANPAPNIFRNPHQRNHPKSRCSRAPTASTPCWCCERHPSRAHTQALARLAKKGFPSLLLKRNTRPDTLSSGVDFLYGSGIIFAVHGNQSIMRMPTMCQDDERASRSSVPHQCPHHKCLDHEPEWERVGEILLVPSRGFLGQTILFFQWCCAKPMGRFKEVYTMRCKVCGRTKKHLLQYQALCSCCGLRMIGIPPWLSEKTHVE